MSAPTPSIFCPRCGTPNQAIARFCISCGTQLPVSPTAPPVQAPIAPPAQVPPVAPVPPVWFPPSTPMPPQAWYPSPDQYYAYTAAYYEYQRREQVQRTGTALLLMAIGFFLNWLPYYGAIGYLLEGVGALLVITGNRAFGPKQARNIFWSIIIFVIGIAATVVTAFVSIILTISPPGGASPTFVNWYALVDIVWVGFVGIVTVLLVYELELTTGRILLWIGFSGSIITSIVNLFVLPSILTNSVSNISYTFLLNGLVSLAPAIIKGLAYLLARERIVHGEIPTPQQLAR